MFHALDLIIGPAFFWAFALITVLCGIGLLLARHPINGAINLIGVMLSLSGIYALLNSPFLAVLQVLVYAGAIMMLVVFVIMVLNQAKDHVIPQFDWFSLVALPLPVLLGCAMVSMLSKNPTEAVAGGDAGRIESPKGDSDSLNVPFRAVDAGSNAVYTWNFGDQSTATGREITHHYPKPGLYTATLSVSDGTPAQHSSTVAISVHDAVRGGVQILARAMFETGRHGPGYYLLFELIGVLLLAAVVGAVVLAKRSLDSPAAPTEPAEGHH